MKRSTLIWVTILVVIAIIAVVYFMQPKQSVAPTEPVTTQNAPASKLPSRNVQDIVQPGQPIGNDAMNATASATATASMTMPMTQ
jgi:hypothetical protein